MKATTRQIIVALAILIVVIAFSFSGLNFFWVSCCVYVPQNSQEMEWMQKQLDAKGIRHMIDGENNFVVSSDDNDLYEPLISKIREDRRIFTQAFGSSDKEYMNILMKELGKAGIKYLVDYKDEIKYMEYDRPRFKSIQSKVDNIIAGGISKTFSDTSPARDP